MDDETSTGGHASVRSTSIAIDRERALDRDREKEREKRAAAIISGDGERITFLTIGLTALTFFIVGFVVAAHMYPHHLYPLTTNDGNHDAQFIISSGDATIDASLMEKRVMVSTLRGTLNDRRAEADEINTLIRDTQKQLHDSTQQLELEVAAAEAKRQARRDAS